MGCRARPIARPGHTASTRRDRLLSRRQASWRRSDAFPMRARAMTGSGFTFMTPTEMVGRLWAANGAIGAWQS